MADFTEAIRVLRGRAKRVGLFAFAAAPDFNHAAAVLEAARKFTTEDFYTLEGPFKGVVGGPNYALKLKLKALRDAVEGA